MLSAVAQDILIVELTRQPTAKMFSSPKKRTKIVLFANHKGPRLKPCGTPSVITGVEQGSMRKKGSNKRL